MSASKKDQNIKQYNVTISKLIKLILRLNEEHQKALLKKGQELLSKEKRAPRKSCRIPVRYKTFDRVYSDRIMNISFEMVTLYCFMFWSFLEALMTSQSLT